MYDGEVRAEALESIAAGESLNSISKSMGISRSTLREWRDAPGDITTARVSDCPRCHPSLQQMPSETYAHLLGLYLGDGYVSALKKGVYSLRITCDDKYPRLIDEVAAAIKAVHPSRPVYRVQRIGCTDVQSFWKHWPCLFPQYGVGAKHTRKIELADWQAEVVRQHPGLFLRGLFNSDGCRITNWTTRPVGGEMKRFEYPRYFFTNTSADIIGLCTWALDLLDIAWRRPHWKQVSVARRDAVAKLDDFVGPKS